MSWLLWVSVFLYKLVNLWVGLFKLLELLVRFVDQIAPKWDFLVESPLLQGSYWGLFHFLYLQKDLSFYLFINLRLYSFKKLYRFINLRVKLLPNFLQIDLLKLIKAINIILNQFFKIIFLKLMLNLQHLAFDVLKKIAS